MTDASEETLAKAEAKKTEANGFFAKKKWTQAIDLYTEAIELNPLVAAYYGNRAFAYIKIEAYGAAIADAEMALRVDPSYIKAYYRKASANFALGHFKDAVDDFKVVAKKRPSDKDAATKLKQATAVWKRDQFEKAIAFEHRGESALDGIDVNDLDFGDSYNGPSLGPNGTVTLEFLEAMKKTFKDGERLHNKIVINLLAKARGMLESLPTLVDVKVPSGGKITVCGDTHGQYFDLCNIFELNGNPSETNPYVFNGDFVDRGSWSFEVVFTLLAWKLYNPAVVHMTRGNHETLNMNKIYGFEGEVKHKHNETIFRIFTEVFCRLPLSVCLNRSVLILHGGLFSKDGVTLDNIRAIERFSEPPADGLFSELLWSDPAPDPGRHPSKRGTGVAFGPDVTAAFLDANNLTTLVRSHEVREEGYTVEHDGRCITIFSAPNYCDSVGNKGAFITYRANDDGGLEDPEFTSFEAVPHPPVAPMAYAGMGFGGMGGLQSLMGML